MPSPSLHEQYIAAYILHIIIRAIIQPPQTLEDLVQELNVDISCISAIRQTRYLQSRSSVAKSGSLHLAWEYAQNPSDHRRFVNMLRVPPTVFQVILALIKDHPIFYNQSNQPQESVEVQLGVTLYRMGRYGNGASVEDVAHFAGCSEGAVELYTKQCFTAIESFHNDFVCLPTDQEKEKEKCWIDQHLGFRGTWREGWVMYDGTIVVLYAKPGLNGDAYFTRKSNYGLNLQIGNLPSNLRIVDYSHGLTGSAHDAWAFEHTGAAKYPDWFFKGEEFAWGDSAYPLSSRTIPVHKKPASLLPQNAAFDHAVANLRVRSEHCMGALKGRFQCLRGLRVTINSNQQHIAACQWMTIAIILHNIVIEVEGAKEGEYFRAQAEGEGGGVQGGDEEEDLVPQQGGLNQDGEAKRQKLIAELLAFKHQ